MSAFNEFLTTQKDFYLPAKVTKDTGFGYFSVKIPLSLPVTDSTDILVSEFSVKGNNTLVVNNHVKIKLKEVPCHRDKRQDGSEAYHPRPKATLQDTIDKIEYDEQITKLNNIRTAFDEPNGENIKSLKQLFSEAHNWFSFKSTDLYSNFEKFNSILSKLEETTQAVTAELDAYKLTNAEVIQQLKKNQSLEAEFKKAQEKLQTKQENIEKEQEAIHLEKVHLVEQQQAIHHDITQLKACGLYKTLSKEAENTAEDFNSEKFHQALSYPQSPLIEKSFQLALVGSLIRGRLILLEGSVGVGKTHLAENFATRLGGKSETIPVRPSWIDSSDLFGFFDPLSRIFRPASFTEAICNAPTDRVYPVILDEMNLSRIENYGADLLSRIEKIADSRLIDKQQDQEDMLQIWSSAECTSLIEELTTITKLPNYIQKPEYIQRINQVIYSLEKYRARMPLPDGFILMGTLNADESTFEVSPKVIDRSYVLSFPNLSISHFNTSTNKNDTFNLSIKAFRQKFRQAIKNPDKTNWLELNKIISDEEMAEIGIPYSYRLMTDYADMRAFCEIMGYQEKEYEEAFIWSHILPRISFFKSPNEQKSKTQKAALDKLLNKSSDKHIKKYFEKQMNDDNRILVKFFGR